MSTVAHPQIEFTSDGHARIRGTGFKVRILVEEYLAGATPSELLEGHPQLSLSKIHAALSYYYDHKQEIDDEIAELNRFVKELRAQQGESLLAKKLREMGKDLP
jgi:uncharacterized protein (DUF433 family)